MAGGGDVCDGGGDALNRPQKVSISTRDQPRHSLFTSAPSSNSLLGPRTMLSFGAVGGANRLGNSLFQCFEQEECGDEYLDEYFNQPEKKRRLSIDKVQFLEKSFEADNKLEPERKIQLAKELGLQPRQIAIWFQNRRARWKTRQLETDYETLNANYKSLKTDYDNLVKENEKLKAEVLYLKHNGLARDTEKGSSQSCDAAELPKKAIVGVICEDEESKTSSANEDQSSERTDLANVGPSHVLEPDWSDLSHNGEDELNEELLQQPDYVFPKMEGSHCHTPTSTFYYGLPAEDHAFSFWSY